MGEIATIRVRYTASGHEALINRDDFDPALHTHVDGDAAPAPVAETPPRSATPGRVVRRGRERFA
jgi:hypothetical protein